MRLVIFPILETFKNSFQINYKTQNVAAELEKCCKGEVTCYFDNVGGETSENVIANMAKDAHIVLCGQISSYNDDPKNYPNKLPDAITKVILSNYRNNVNFEKPR